jgi:hypothetical protein
MLMPPPLETEINTHNAPTIPSHHQIQWADAIVKWTRDSFIEVLTIPHDDCGESLAQVFKGDFVQVSPRHHTRQWCLCRVGYMMGWLNMNDVKFMIHSQQLEPPQAEEDKSPKRALVSRLIGFFKKT